MTAITAPASSPRILGLDGIRAFAVVAVIAAHAHVPWLHGGGVGVDLFFVISGFLITGLLLRERTRLGGIQLARFWGRRLLRLMPALLLMLLALSAFIVLFGEHLGRTWDVSLAATPSVLFYFSNWIIVAGGDLGAYGPLWSLSVEEQFYLVWPLVIILVMIAAKGVKMLAGIAAVLIVAVNVNRFATFDGSNLDRTFGTDYRVDLLLMGALLAMALEAGGADKVRRVARVLVIPSVIYLVAIAIVVPDFNSGSAAIFDAYYTFGLPLVGVAGCAVVGYVTLNQGSMPTRFLSIRPLEWTGRISYGLYLWHFPVLLLLTGAIAPPTESAVHTRNVWHFRRSRSLLVSGRETAVVEVP